MCRACHVNFRTYQILHHFPQTSRFGSTFRLVVCSAVRQSHGSPCSNLRSLSILIWSPRTHHLPPLEFSWTNHPNPMLFDAEGGTARIRGLKQHPEKHACQTCQQVWPDEHRRLGSYASHHVRVLPRSMLWEGSWGVFGASRPCKRIYRLPGKGILARTVDT